jgi:protein-S-isoprenylcysteine O-methyltransferase Ste14
VGILAWFLLAFGVNHVYFITSEEPGLYKRFGDEYLEYKKNVPRWIPRLTPWSRAKS